MKKTIKIILPLAIFLFSFMILFSNYTLIDSKYTDTLNIIEAENLNNGVNKSSAANSIDNVNSLNLSNGNDYFIGDYVNIDFYDNDKISYDDISLIYSQKVNSIKSCWRYENNLETKIIVFVDDNIIAFWSTKNKETEIYYYILTDNSILIKNKSITYSYDINKTNEMIHESEYIDGRVVSDNEEKTYSIFSNDFLKVLYDSGILWKILEGIGSIIAFAVVLSHTSFIINFKYKKSLNNHLANNDYLWLSDNEVKDIFIPVYYYNNNCKNYDNLLVYFYKNLFNNSNNNYIILGDAGEGKTFSINKLASSILNGFVIKNDKDDDITKLYVNKDTNKKIKKLTPVILQFTKMSGFTKENDILNYIYENICLISNKRIREKALFSHIDIKKTITKLLNNGKFIILIDGYDEVVDENRGDLSECIISFMNKYNKNKFVLSSRTIVYENEKFENIPNDNTIFLAPLNNDQIKSFVYKWKYPINKSSSELYQRIITTEQIKHIVQNPLLLTMVTFTYCKTDANFDKSKVALYQKCCKCLLQDWEKEKTTIRRKRFKIINNIEFKEEILSEIAYYLFTHNIKTLKENKVIEVIQNISASKAYGKAANIFSELMIESGLLVKKDEIGFRHNSFYEYYVAQYLLKNYNRLDYIIYNKLLNEQNIAFFYYSSVENEKDVTDFVKNNQDKPQLIRDILLERKINDEDLVFNFITYLANITDYSKINEVQVLSYIAKEYPSLSKFVMLFFKRKMISVNDQQTKVNLLIGILIIGDSKNLVETFSLHLNSSDLKQIIYYSNDAIDLNVRTILNVLRDNQKYEFIENLSKSIKFNAVYNLYINAENDIERCFALIGFMYMTKSKILYKKLENVNFYNHLSKEDKFNVQKLKKKYGWVDNKYTNEQIDCIYTLVYLLSKYQMLIFNNNIKYDLIDNKFAFLISYAISEKDNRIVQYFNGPRVESVVEYSYHWNRLKNQYILSKKKGKDIKNNLKLIQNVFYSTEIVNVKFLKIIYYILISLSVIISLFIIYIRFL